MWIRKQFGNVYHSQKMFMPSGAVSDATFVNLFQGNNPKH